jgi:hypothetical protein
LWDILSRISTPLLICPESTCMSLLLIITALCSIQFKSG